MSLLLSIFVVLLTSFIIYKAGEFFTDSSSKLGSYINISRAVKGTTIDAVASSLPELLTVLFAILFFRTFDLGLGTIVGSALFNILIIPALAVLVSPLPFIVGKEVVFREGLFYILALVLLILAVFLFGEWGLLIPIIFLLTYVIYLFVIYSHTKRFRLKSGVVKRDASSESLSRIISILVISTIIIAIATYYLVGASVNIANILNISHFIIGFVVVAAATSVPDMVISLINARKGNIDDSASNVFGSNIFDILVGLSLPSIIAYFLIGPTKVSFQHKELLVILFVSTIVIFSFLLINHRLRFRDAIILLLIYLFVILYVIFLVL